MGKHLEEYYNILKELLQDIAVKNIQRTIEAAFSYAVANPQKRRRLDIEEVS